MRLDVSRFKSGVQHIERQYAPEAFGLEGEDFRLIAPVTLVADLTRDEQKIRLQGRVSTVLECDCSRCLEPFAVPMTATLDLLLLPSAPEADLRDGETPDDAFGVAFFKDDVIDLGEIMREQFYLAAPMKPLCREDCKGLCPTCGINRNRETCDCRIEWTDPRLEALKHLTKGN